MGEVYKKFTTTLYEARYKVEEDQNGMRLDQYCSEFLASFSRQAIKRKIARGEVQIVDRAFPHKPSVKVYENEIIVFTTPRGDLEDEYWRGEKLDLEFDPEVIFEDDDIIVIGKPPYMTTHPSGKHLFNCATVYFEEKYNHTIHSIHRLDRETSGVLALAKNPKAAGKLTSLFEKNLVSKCYFFIAHNKNPTDFPFTAKERMGDLPDFIPRLFVHCFDEESEEGKHAETHFKKLYSNDEYVIGLAFPKTGRQHQIRVHAAFHGLPLVGDKLYNGDPTLFMRFKDEIPTLEDHDKMDLSRHALHATGLCFPYNGERQLFRASVPKDLRQWIKKNMSEVELEKIDLEISALIKDFFQMS